MTGLFLKRLPALLVLLASTSDLSAQAAGSVTGRITDKAGGAPLVGAQVRIEGTNFGAITNGDGRYTISRVAPGAYQLRVIRIGYLSALSSITVSASGAATGNFSLT